MPTPEYTAKIVRAKLRKLPVALEHLNVFARCLAKELPDALTPSTYVCAMLRSIHTYTCSQDEEFERAKKRLRGTGQIVRKIDLRDEMLCADMRNLARVAYPSAEDSVDA